MGDQSNKSGTPIPRRIKRDLKGNPGEVAFTTFEEARAWADEEQRSWDNVANWDQRPIASLVNDAQKAPLRAILDATANCGASNFDPTEARAAVIDALEAYADHRCLHRQSAAAEFVRQLKPKGGIMMIGALAAATGTMQWDKIADLNPAETHLLISGYAAMHGYLQPTRQEAATLRRAISRVIAEGQQNNEANQAAHKAAMANLGQEQANQAASHEEMRKHHKQAMEDIEKTFRDAMELRAPRTYWAEKAESHSKKARWAFGAFIAFAVVGAGTAVWEGIGFLKYIASLEKEPSAAVLGVIAAVAVGTFFWTLRLLSRMFITNYTLASDAELRTTMVSTFLALMEERERSGINEADRLLILQALFRPAANEAHEDGPHPAWADFLLEKLKSR